MSLLNRRRRSKGQSTGEYVVMLGCLLGAAYAMVSYCQDRIRGAIKNYADDYESEVGGGTYRSSSVSNSSSSSSTQMDSAYDGTISNEGSGTSTTTF